MKPTEQIHPSSGNVFADLCLSDPQESLQKAKLAQRICAAIAERGLTQAQAAALLKLDQPKISALRRGKLRGFSLERLFRCLKALDHDVEILVRPSRRSSRLRGTRRR